MNDKEIYKLLRKFEESINDKLEALSIQFDKYESILNTLSNRNSMRKQLNEQGLKREEERRVKNEAYEILKRAGFSAKYKDILYKILTHTNTESVESVIYDERLDVFKLDQNKEIIVDEKTRRKLDQILMNEGFDEKYEDILYKLITHSDTQSLESIIYDSRLQVFKTNNKP